MATIEGTGIATPSKESSKKATAFLSNFQKKADEKFIKTYERKQEGNIQNSDFETDRYNKLKKKYGDQFSSDARSNYFSPGGGAYDPRNNVETASADIQSLSVPGSEAFNQEVDQYDRNMQKRVTSDQFGEKGTEERFKNVGDSYQIYRQLRYENNPGGYIQGQDFSKAPTKEKPSFIDQTKNLAGSIFNTVTGTQPASASQIPGGMPSGTQFSPSGDTSFSSFRMGGGVKGQQSGIVTPFSQTSMGKGEPRNITKFQDTSMGRKTVTVDGQQVAKNQTVASLPSDYKQTEAREFAKAKAYQQANKNPNVTTSIDSKGQVTVSPVQRGRGEAGTSDNTAQGNQARVQQNAKARAQAAAINRKISGRSISQTKAANNAAMRKSAAERHATFKKTGKSTVGARRAAAKKKVQAAAKKRHAAFKKRRAARRKKKSKKK